MGSDHHDTPTYINDLKRKFMIVGVVLIVFTVLTVALFFFSSGLLPYLWQGFTLGTGVAFVFNKKWSRALPWLGAILIGLTGITWWAFHSNWQVEHKFWLVVLIAMEVAVIKSSLVICVFMHYWWDAKWAAISLVMVVTLFFFGGMMYLTNSSELADKPGNETAFDPITGMPKIASENPKPAP